MPEKEEKKEESKKGVGTCGFENKQYFGESGRKMTCVLSAGHPGDHAAPYPEDGADKDVLVSFSDAAGTPPDKGTLAKVAAEKTKKEAAAKAAAK
jgi:hypothetical protein